MSENCTWLSLCVFLSRGYLVRKGNLKTQIKWGLANKITNLIQSIRRKILYSTSGTSFGSNQNEDITTHSVLFYSLSTYIYSLRILLSSFFSFRRSFIRRPSCRKFLWSDEVWIIPTIRHMCPNRGLLYLLRILVSIVPSCNVMSLSHIHPRSAWVNMLTININAKYKNLMLGYL